jgi:hypothetical protein
MLFIRTFLKEGQFFKATKNAGFRACGSPPKAHFFRAHSRHLPSEFAVTRITIRHVEPKLQDRETRNKAVSAIGISLVD